MNQDQKKFTLIAYEKGNISNRKNLKYTIKIGDKIEEKDKYNLVVIDNYTSCYTQLGLYNALLKKGAIKKEQTEFVIWYKEKDKIKQLPVIYNDKSIRMYAEYLIGQDAKINTVYNDIEHVENYDHLNDEVFHKFIRVVDMDSTKYDGLSENDKNDFMNKDSFSARYYRLPFALYESKQRVKDRIMGAYNPKEEKIVKSKYVLNRNYYGIKNEIKSSYRSFRDKYLFLKYDIDYENLYRNLTIEDLDVVPIKEVIYNVQDYLNLVINFETRSSFNDFVWDSKLVTKKVKNYTNRLAKAFLDSDSEESYCESIIREFDRTHKGVINELIHEYCKLNKNIKVKEKVIER